MRLFVIVVFLYVMIGCGRQQVGSHDVSMAKTIDVYASKLLDDARFHSVSIVVYKGGDSFIQHYGELEVHQGNSPTDKSLYELGSVTKVFVGLLAAQAVLDGKIDLEDDARLYLKGEYKNLQFNDTPVTVKHLLTHTGIFPNFPIKGETKAEFFEGIAEINIDKEPGTSYYYSNTAPELMAHILEVAYGKPYQDLLDIFIFSPQGMTETTLTGENHQLIKGYNADGELMPNFSRKLWGGAVGLNSTPSDLLKFIRLQLDATNDVVRESHKPLYQVDDELSIAYHWFIQEEQGVVRYMHHGGIYGMQNWLVIYPEYDFGISVISNASFDGAGDALLQVVNAIFEHLN